MPYHGSSVSKATLAFQIEGWCRLGSRKSTLAAGIAPATIGWVSGLGLNRPSVVGHLVAPLPLQVMLRAATPGLEKAFEIQTEAAAPWNRPTPPRTCIGRSVGTL